MVLLKSALAVIAVLLIGFGGYVYGTRHGIDVGTTVWYQDAPWEVILGVSIASLLLGVIALAISIWLPDKSE